MWRQLTLLVFNLALFPLLCGPALASEPAPPEEVVFSRGMTLDQIATDRYGNRKFSILLARFNQIDPRSIRAGEIIRTPSLPIIFEEVGLIPEYRAALGGIFSVLDEYQVLLREYEPLRREAGGYRDEGRLTLPRDLEVGFLALADSLSLSARMIELQSERGGNVPRLTIGQLKNAEVWLRKLASGQVDGYGYDVDLVFQHLALALANAVAWSRE